MGSNSRMDLSEVGWEGVDWIHVAQDKDQWFSRTLIRGVN